jgi:hypothetical protein
MKETRVTLPELALIAGTRVIGGAGLGLLLSNRLSEGQRRAVGWTLLLVGGLSTVPLALEVFGKGRPSPLRSASLGESVPGNEVPRPEVVHAG